jgi:hypothetical protein
MLEAGVNRNDLFNRLGNKDHVMQESIDIDKFQWLITSSQL